MNSIFKIIGSLVFFLLIACFSLYMIKHSKEEALHLFEAKRLFSLGKLSSIKKKDDSGELEATEKWVVFGYWMFFILSISLVTYFGIALFKRI